MYRNPVRLRQNVVPHTLNSVDILLEFSAFVLNMFEPSAGHRLLSEKLIRPHLQAGRPLVRTTSLASSG